MTDDIQGAALEKFKKFQESAAATKELAIADMQAFYDFVVEAYPNRIDTLRSN